MRHQHEWFEEEMDPDYRAQIFMARKQLLGNVTSPTILPDYGLHARALLDEKQIEKVQAIRQRRLAAVADQFIPD
ncbi:MAG: hypothetical protein CMN76_04720 [Spirochaetaceae bacterium]|nr:hypothetical protein [Spirochaetaceae bacterium]|tara:strand:+ start:423008 stop:423232 length:225 start_codon:yes stop_codon:yes gene_type:complete